MSDSQPRLDVSAPKTMRTGRERTGGGLVPLLLVVLVALNASLAWKLFGAGAAGGAPGSTNADPAALRATALRLEEMGVPAAAAATWERHLDHGAGEPADRALVRYRVGKLWQDAGEWDRALAAYVEAEKGGLAEPGAKKAIGNRILDCLKALGRYGAVGAELDRRTGLAGDDDPSPVVARFAGDTITRAAFDRWLEERLDRAFGGADVPAAQRDAMLRRYREPEAAARLLDELVVQRLMVLRAREEKLDRDEAVRAQVRDAENAIVAQALFAREVDERIEPTESDVASFLAANAERYREPPQATVRVIEVASVEEGTKRLASLADAEAFVAASEAAEAPIVRGEPWTPYGRDAALEAAVFDAAPGTTLDRPWPVGDRVLLVHVVSKREGSDASLDSVRDRVRADYVQRKRAELSDALVETLKRRYDVRIDLGGLAHDTAPTDGEPR